MKTPELRTNCIRYSATSRHKVFAVVLILSVITDLWRMDSGKLTRTREVPGTSVWAPLR